MGTFAQQIRVSDLQGRPSTVLEAKVDTSATYLVIPQDVLGRLGVRTTGRRRFRLADKRRIEYPVVDVLLHLDGESHPMLCVFALGGATPLLGAVPLETFGLAVDPIGKRLVPVEGLLLSLSHW